MQLVLELTLLCVFLSIRSLQRMIQLNVLAQLSTLWILLDLKGLTVLEQLETVSKRVLILTDLFRFLQALFRKTVMIAALSPADISYSETLSTLRYAERAKQIKTNAVVNNKLQENVLKEILAENERLKKQLQEMINAADIAAPPGISPEERARMQDEIRTEIMAQLENNRERLENQDKDAFKKKLEEARKEATTAETLIAARPSARVHPECPFITNLNEDPQLSGVIIHYLNAEKIIIGREGAPGNLNLTNSEKVSYILLKGLNIQNIHATFTRLPDGRMELSVGSNSLRNTKVNGTTLTTSVILRPMDRILFGSYHLYVYHNNVEKCDGVPANVDWDFAQKELAKSEGIDQLDKTMDENDRSILQQELIELLPMLQEVNSIAKEMNKERTFDIILLPGLLQQTVYGQHKATKLVVRMKCTKTGHTWMWERGKFLSRRFLIQEIYQSFEDGSAARNPIKQENDPFWEPLEPLLVGFAPAFLQSLSYGLDYTDRLQISDLDGQSIGKLAVSLQPCLATGEFPDGENREGLFVEDPKKLLGKPFYFNVGVSRISLPGLLHGTKTSLRYSVYKELKPTIIRLDASQMQGHSGKLDISHNRKINFKKVTNELLAYFEKECIAFLVYIDQGNTDNLDNESKIPLSASETAAKQIRRGSIAVVKSIDLKFRNSMNRKLDERRASSNTIDSRDEHLKKLYNKWSKVTPSPKAFQDLLRELENLFKNIPAKPNTHKIHDIAEVDEDEEYEKSTKQSGTSKKRNPFGFATKVLRRKK
ncbi:unnamed protein product [Hymenolepis diminuta]|uniref:Kinesin motor domain-containing protein n=1 Tax=Hymenolepis diminuta TaxID=6216 RepID=A0A564Y9N1_HYMDI|nr:unnamed protein product [Hymenolepis diminuta]